MARCSVHRPHVLTSVPRKVWSLTRFKRSPSIHTALKTTFQVVTGNLWSGTDVQEDFLSYSWAPFCLVGCAVLAQIPLKPLRDIFSYLESRILCDQTFSQLSSCCWAFSFLFFSTLFVSFLFCLFHVTKSAPLYNLWGMILVQWKLPRKLFLLMLMSFVRVGYSTLALRSWKSFLAATNERAVSCNKIWWLHSSAWGCSDHGYHHALHWLPNNSNTVS